MKSFNYVNILVIFGFVFQSFCEIQQADAVFTNWLCWQKCYENYAFDEMSDHINEIFQQRFNKHYLKHQTKLTTLVPFLNDFTQGYIAENGNLIGDSIDEDLRENFLTVYSLVENNMPRFVSYLKDHNFISDETNNEDQKTVNKDMVIDKYRAFARLIFSNPNKKNEKEILFSFANHCFEYCFYPDTWPDFKQYLDDDHDHQIVRFLYSSMWENFVGKGWKDWNSQIISRIADKARQGYRVVYVAGGADIYQLLKHGVYNIDIIDPFLQTQSKFYASSDWEWLVKGRRKNGGLQDRIEFDFDGLKISMIRKKYVKKGDRSITEWSVVEGKKKQLGTVIFYRRLCEQNDFSNEQKRLMLMSFNELYYAFLPSKSGGWDINAELLPKNFEIYVKQLRMPIDVSVLQNIRWVEDSSFKFIRLGSQVA